MVGPKVFSWSEPIQIRNQFGDWMHVESAAPMPVPVQMRMPRLNIAEAWPTPAVRGFPLAFAWEERKERGRTEFQLAGPHCFRGVQNEVLGEVALHAADHVVGAGLAALADDAEGVVFHDGCAAYTAE
jgi:hypothetical protein